jgi:hypothetical protein
VDNNRALGARAYPSGPRYPTGFHSYRDWPVASISVPLLNSLDIFQQHQIMATIARLDAEVLNNESGDRYDSQ